MDQVLHSVIMPLMLWAVGGFLVGLMLLGLSRSSDWLFEKTGLPLKYQALVPPLIMALIGLCTSLAFIPYVFILYGFVVLLLCLGRADFFDPPVLNQLIGASLLGMVTVPLMVIALHFFGGASGSDYYSFYLYNHSSHEIVLEEVQVDGSVIFKRRPDLGQEVTLLSDPKAWGGHWDAEFSRWPEKITLRGYNLELQKEVRGEVRLPRSRKHYVCGFDIVYESEAFRCDDRPCD